MNPSSRVTRIRRIAVAFAVACVAVAATAWGLRGAFEKSCGHLVEHACPKAGEPCRALRPIADLLDQTLSPRHRLHCARVEHKLRELEAAHDERADRLPYLALMEGLGLKRYSEQVVGAAFGIAQMQLTAHRGDPITADRDNLIAAGPGVCPAVLTNLAANDTEEPVRRALHEALVTWNGGTDLGPTREAWNKWCDAKVSEVMRREALR